MLFVRLITTKLHYCSKLYNAYIYRRHHYLRTTSLLVFGIIQQDIHPVRFGHRSMLYSQPPSAQRRRSNVVWFSASIPMNDLPALDMRSANMFAIKHLDTNRLGILRGGPSADTIRKMDDRRLRSWRLCALADWSRSQNPRRNRKADEIATIQVIIIGRADVDEHRKSCLCEVKVFLQACENKYGVLMYLCVSAVFAWVKWLLFWVVLKWRWRSAHYTANEGMELNTTTLVPTWMRWAKYMWDYISTCIH